MHAKERRRERKKSEMDYGKNWQKIRAEYLKVNPICQDCKQAIATEVHHKRALRHGGTHDWSNLKALCKGCHSRRTLKGGVG